MIIDSSLMKEFSKYPVTTMMGTIHAAYQKQDTKTLTVSPATNPHPKQDEPACPNFHHPVVFFPKLKLPSHVLFPSHIILAPYF